MNLFKLLVSLALLFSLVQAQCQVNVMNSSQAEQFLMLPMLMQANQISSSSTPAASSQQVVNVFSQNSGVVNSSTVAAVLGMTPQQVAQQAGVPVGADITLTQAEQIASTAGKSNLISQILGLVSSQTPVSPADGLSVTLPNGLKMPLSVLNNLTSINSSNCMVNGMYINGQVEYQGLLTSGDVYYGLTSSPSTSTEQHLSSSSFTAGVNLGTGGSNMVLPYTYTRWLISSGWINGADTLINSVASMGMYSTLGTATPKVTASDLESLAKANSVLETTAKSAASDLASTLTSIENPADKQALDSIIYKLSSGATPLSSDELATLNKLAASDPVLQTSLSDYNTKLSSAQQVAQQMSGSISKPSTQDIADYTALTKATLAKATSSFILGMTWLGPARFAFQINSALLFSNPSNNGDFYVLLKVNRNTLTSLMTVSDILGLGYFDDTLSKLFGIGVPNAALTAGEMYIINQPSTTSQTSGSTTTFNNNGLAWQVQTNWPGSSTVTNFQKLNPSSNLTTIELTTNSIPPGAVISRLDVLKYQALAVLFAVPFVSTLTLPGALKAGLGSTFAGLLPDVVMKVIPFIGISDIVYAINNNVYNSVEPCSQSTMTDWIVAYGSATAFSDVWAAVPILSSWSSVFGSTLKGFSTAFTGSGIFGSLGSSYLTFSKFQGPQLMQMIVGGLAAKYASTCIDSEYYVAAFQPTPTPNSAALASANSVNNLANNSVVKNLGLGGLLQGAGQNIQNAALASENTLIVSLTNQNGLVMPTQLYYIHMTNADIQWWGKFSNKCFHTCLSDSVSNITACINGQTGVQVKTPAGTIQLAGSTRAKGQQEIDKFGLDLIPNAYITTELTCSGVFATVSNQDLILSGGCPGGACILSSVSQIVGYQVGDLGPVMGKVDTILTDNGSISFPSGSPVFNNASNGSSVSFTTLQINGNGEVVGDNANLGTLESIKFDNGAMWYDSSNGELIIFIYQLASALASSFSALNAQVSNCTVGNQTTPAIDLSVGANAANAPAAQQFNTALNQIQQGCGVEQWQTNSTIYTLHNVNGTPTLTVTDALTKTSTDYPLSSLQQDGNKVVATTADGKQFSFTFANGPAGPQVTVNTPTGGTSSDILTKATGLGGILAYDPATGTWEVLNGQGIPMSTGFAAGNTITGGAGGSAVSTPSGDLLGVTPGGSASTFNVLAALPSFDGVLVFVFAGIAFASGVLIFTFYSSKRSTSKSSAKRRRRKV